MSAWLYPSRQISRINFTKKLTMFLFFYISFTKPTPGKRVPAFAVGRRLNAGAERSGGHMALELECLLT